MGHGTHGARTGPVWQQGRVRKMDQGDRKWGQPRPNVVTTKKSCRTERLCCDQRNMQPLQQNHQSLRHSSLYLWWEYSNLGWQPSYHPEGLCIFLNLWCGGYLQAAGPGRGCGLGLLCVPLYWFWVLLPRALGATELADGAAGAGIPLGGQDQEWAPSFFQQLDFILFSYLFLELGFTVICFTLGFVGFNSALSSRSMWPMCRK